MQLNRFRRLGAQAQVEEFHENRKAHGEVDIALGDMLVQTFNHQRKSNEEKKSQGEHFYRRVFADKVADALHRKLHNAHSHYNGRNHDSDLVRHANRSNHGVEGKHDVQQHDLKNHAVELSPNGGVGVALLTFQLVVNLKGALANNEKYAAQ